MPFSSASYAKLSLPISFVSASGIIVRYSCVHRVTFGRLRTCTCFGSTFTKFVTKNARNSKFHIHVWPVCQYRDSVTLAEFEDLYLAQGFRLSNVTWFIFMSPPDRVGRHIDFPRASVRPSVRPSVRHKSCPLYNLKTVKDFSMKLVTLVNHDETMCHAQEP